MTGWPGTPWPCGHSELVQGCECGNFVAAWWAETKRRTAESHGKTVEEFYGEEARRSA